jgi:hypothetical protein
VFSKSIHTKIRQQYNKHNTEAKEVVGIKETERSQRNLGDYIKWKTRFGPSSPPRE